MTGTDRAGETLRKAGAIEASVTSAGGGAVGLRAGARDWEVLAWREAGAAPFQLSGESSELDGGTLLVAERSHESATTLRALVPWLRPRLLGDGPSVGLGDRLGIAGPGHVAALRASPGLSPVLAQQSAREIGRTGRDFADVVDGATFGALASGWREGYAADADHLETMAELERGLAAGVTMFTSDPKALVPDLPADAPRAAIEAAYERVPWAELEDDRASFEARYARSLDLGDGALPLPADAVQAAAARFGPALVRVVAMYRRLVSELGRASFTFEVAVDEINHPTTPVDHVYIATELRRLGLAWESLAPHFVGEFEKGVDYLGDPASFGADVRIHARIAERFGGYKIGVHSGSDKFSIYRTIADATGGKFHLKTSGTSYLAALRTLAETEPELFRRIWHVASKTYASARASYHVSAAADAVPAADRLSDGRVVALLDDRNSREILHVTYGAILNGDERDLGPAVREAAWRHRDAYWAGLAAHIERHLRPLVAEARLVGGGR